MQSLIVVIYKDHEENLRSEVIDPYFELYEIRENTTFSKLIQLY